MRRLSIILALLIFVSLASTAFSQTDDGDNTLFEVVWSSSDTTAFEAVWQGAVKGGFDFDCDCRGEFLTLLADARWEYPEPAKSGVLSMVEASGDNSYTVAWQIRLEGDPSKGGGQRSLAVGDLDGDRNQEIIVALETGLGMPGVYFFEEESNSLPSVPSCYWDPRLAGVVGSEGLPHEGRWDFEIVPHVADLDGDGKQELILPAAAGLAIVELTSGDIACPTWDVEYLNTTDLIHSYALQVTDLNGDGLKEIVYASVWATSDWANPMFYILECTGEDSYNLTVTLDWNSLPAQWAGCNGHFVEADLDFSGSTELYIPNVNGTFWVVDPEGDFTFLDSTYFYLLHSFPSQGWDVGDAILGDQDHGPCTDGPDIYIAAGESGDVLDVEYEGGDITDPASYSVYTIFDDPEDGGANPFRLALGEDMDRDGNKELVIESVNQPRSVPTVYVLEWGGTCPGDVGDVNYDISINVLDVIIAVGEILRPNSLEKCEKFRADCNADGAVNVLDLIGIINIILGQGTCPPAAKATVSPDVIEYLESVSSHFAPEDYTKLMALFKEVQIPVEYSLSQNYPNPFNPETSIAFALPRTTRVSVRVYNVLGQEVNVLVDSEMEGGYHSVKWNGTNSLGHEVSGGIYFYSLRAGDYSSTRKMLLLK